MFGLARKEIETNVGRQTLIDLASNPFALFSALGHVWLWSAFDKQSNSMRPFSAASQPDFTRLSGVLALGIEGEKLSLLDISIEGPTISGSGLRYDIKTSDGRANFILNVFVQSSAHGNKLIASIEATELTEERLLSFIPFVGGQKMSLRLFAQHLLDDHLAPYVTKYLEPREATSPKIDLTPTYTLEDDVKILLIKLNDLVKGVNEGFVTISNKDFTFLVTVEGGNIKNMVYRDPTSVLRGTSALGTVFLKPGRATMKVYDVSIDDVLLKLAESGSESKVAKP